MAIHYHRTAIKIVIIITY